MSGACVDCGPNEVCELRGAARPVTTGYYSPTGTNVEFICPGGYDCTDPDNIVKCATGFYSPEGTIACTQCVAPYACPFPELGLSQQIDCTNVRGYYQIANGKTSCQPCAAGNKCPYGDAAQTPCDAGTWSLPAAEFCHVCPPGYECPYTDKPEMNYCLTGTYSVGK